MNNIKSLVMLGFTFLTASLFSQPAYVVKDMINDSFTCNTSERLQNIIVVKTSFFQEFVIFAPDIRESESACHSEQN